MNLSIITINKNNEIGLSKTIESVISQNYIDFEYIIIDGASEDTSVDIISSNCDKIDYWISEPDNGVFHAMNKGIEISRGNYLLFLNSGDYLANSNVLSELLDNNIFTSDFIFFQCAIIEEDTVIHTTQPIEVITLYSLYNHSLPHQSTLIKRDVFLKYGFYREDLKIMSDWEYWIRCIILNNCSYNNVKAVLSCYINNGISSNPKNKYIIENEKRIVFSSPPLNRITPDYFNWQEYIGSLTSIIWLYNKKWANFVINLIYDIVKKIHKFKK